MGYYFLGIGALLLAVAVWATVSRLKLLVTGVRVQGVIVDIDERLRVSGNRKQVYFHPVIEFETSDNHPFRFTYGGASTRRRPTIGDQVTVIYDANKLDTATLNSFFGMWAGPLAAIVLGVGTLYAGVQLVFFESSS